MELVSNKIPNTHAQVKLMSMYEAVFKDIADIDTSILEENVFLAANLPEKMRTLEEGRIDYILENFSKFVLSIMRSDSLQKLCLSTIEHEKQLLVEYQTGSLEEYEANRARTKLNIPMPTDTYEPYVIDFSKYNEDTWTFVISTIRKSYSNIDRFVKTMYEKAMLDFIQDPARIHDLGYMASNFMYFLIAISENDSFYMALLNNIRRIDVLTMDCWNEVKKRVGFHEEAVSHDDEPFLDEDEQLRPPEE